MFAAEKASVGLCDDALTWLGVDTDKKLPGIKVDKPGHGCMWVYTAISTFNTALRTECVLVLLIFTLSLLSSDYFSLFSLFHQVSADYAQPKAGGCPSILPQMGHTRGVY